MINVNAITSTLAKLPDQRLQKYASLHKDDPYIMALAVSESNRRKQRRGAAQAPQGMPKPPKVVDQAVADMAPQELPEDQGIARLPAGNMNYADGGIIAFGDGGEVERYQDGGNTRYPGLMQYGGPYGGAPLLGTGRTGYEGLSVAEALKRMGQDLYQNSWFSESGAERQKRLARERIAPLEAERARNMAKVNAEPAAPAGPRNSPAVNFPSAAEQMRLSDAGRDIPTDSPAPAPAAAAPAPRAAAPRAAPAPAPAAAPSAPTAAGFDMTPKGLQDLRERLGREINVPEPENLRKAREELTAEDVKVKQEAKAALERDQAKFAEAFKGREERLTKRGADIAKQREENTGLAFLNAGLAMMSTPGGLATAVGKGARVGTEQYAAGLDKLRSAQDKLDEARDRLEELKLNRAEMSAKEIREAEAGINAAKVAGKNRGVEALSKMFEVSNKRADTMFTTLAEVGLTQFREGEATKRNTADIAGRLEAARTAAGAPNATMQMAAALGGGTSPAQLEAGLRKMKEAETGKTDMRTLYATYLSGAQRNPGVDVLSYSQFRAQFQIPDESSNNPAAPAAPGTQLARPPGT
jgi:hypothetical protein